MTKNTKAALPDSILTWGLVVENPWRVIQSSECTTWNFFFHLYMQETADNLVTETSENNVFHDHANKYLL